MGIIRIYRSSVTHWCKFGVHMLCCSHDRAVFPIFPNKKKLKKVCQWEGHFCHACSAREQAFGKLHLKKSCFPQLKQENSSILGTTQLFQLYLLLVQPHLEYASDVWDTHLQKDITLIENVQNLGLRICAKQ